MFLVLLDWAESLNWSRSLDRDKSHLFYKQLCVEIQKKSDTLRMWTDNYGPCIWRQNQLPSCIGKSSLVCQQQKDFFHVINPFLFLQTKTNKQIRKQTEYSPCNWNIIWVSPQITILWSQINTCCLSFWLFKFRLIYIVNRKIFYYILMQNRDQNKNFDIIFSINNYLNKV